LYISWKKKANKKWTLSNIVLKGNKFLRQVIVTAGEVWKRIFLYAATKKTILIEWSKKRIGGR